MLNMNYTYFRFNFFFLKKIYYCLNISRRYVLYPFGACSSK
jgi:hypothetical protein